MFSNVLTLLTRYKNESFSPVLQQEAAAVIDKYKKGLDVTSDLLKLAAMFCNEKDPRGNYSPLSILELLLDDYTDFSEGSK